MFSGGKRFSSARISSASAFSKSIVMRAEIVKIFAIESTKAHQLISPVIRASGAKSSIKSFPLPSSGRGKNAADFRSHLALSLINICRDESISLRPDIRRFFPMQISLNKFSFRLPFPTAPATAFGVDRRLLLSAINNKARNDSERHDSSCTKANAFP